MVTALITLSIIVIFVPLFFFLMKDRNHSSSSGMAGLALGATDALLSEDKKRAAQEIVQQQAGERTKADHSGDKAE